MTNDICPHDAHEVSYSDTKNGKKVNGKVCVRCGKFTPAPQLSFFEWAMTKLFRYTDIMRSGTDEIYLRRWFIYPRYKEFKKMEPRIYLHKFYKGDEDPHLHDHPWPFTSVILGRGYWEETSDQDGLTAQGCGTDLCYTLGPNNEHRVQKWYKRFSILKRPATWKHRVVLDDLDEPIWTLIKTGVKERSWGFWIMGKLCPWKNYSQGVCWCGDEKEIPEA